MPYRALQSAATAAKEEKAGAGPASSPASAPEAGLIDEVLESIFGKVETDHKLMAWVVNVGEVRATIDMRTHTVECKDDRVKSQIKVAIKRIVQALYPINCGC